MLSKSARGITPSATCELDGLVMARRAAGEDIIGLNAGEPDFKTPEAIRAALAAAVEAGKTKYTNVAGIPELRAAICDKLLRDNGAAYSPEQICVSTGAKQALNNAVLAVTDPGSEVIIPTPCWVSYLEIVKLYGGVPVCVETLPDAQLDLDAIERAITPRTAAILINTPNNPTGAVYTRRSLERLAALAERHDLYIISDEVYEKLVYGGAEHVCAASLSQEAYERTIVVNGFSKAYAMTGWRIGYSAAGQETASALRAIQSHTTSNSTTFVQWAALAALEQCGAESARMVAEYEKRRDYALARLAAMDGITCRKPDGAFYLLPDVSAYFGKSAKGGVIRDSFDLCAYLLEEARVAIVPGAAFGASRCVRIAYTNSMERIAEAFDRIDAALAALQ